MKLTLYSVFDLEAQTYSSPQVFSDDLSFERWFGAALKQDLVLHLNRQHFQGYSVGSFSTSYGSFENFNPTLIFEGTDSIFDPPAI